MATTFHVVNFKNKLLDLFTGVSGATTPFGFVGFFNGTQPADPSVTPTGAAEFASIAACPNVAGRMGSSAGGISTLAAATAPTTPASAAGVAAITFARLYNTAQAPLIDMSATLAGGGGGAIIDALTSVAGVGSVLLALGFKIPASLGTIILSASLEDRLVDMWAGGSTTPPSMGSTTGGSSTLSLYSGSAPASADVAPTGTLLATFNMTGTNLWAAASGGSAGLNGAGPTVTAVGTGTAAYFRMVKNNGVFVFTLQGSVGTASSDMLVNTTALTSGVTSVQITDATISI